MAKGMKGDPSQEIDIAEIPGLQAELDGKAATPHAAQHTDGTDQIDNATALKAGFMSAADFVKLQNSPTSPFIPQGVIAAAGDFPNAADVEDYWFYIVTADVTDNAGAPKTNTGQSFPSGAEIFWYNTGWEESGRGNNPTFRNLTTNGQRVKTSADITSTPFAITTANLKECFLVNVSGAVAIDIDSDVIAVDDVEFEIIDISGAASTNNITITTEGAEKINGEDSVVIDTDYGYVGLMSDDSSLFVKKKVVSDLSIPWAATYTAWDKRKAILISNETAGTLTDFQVRVTISINANMQADCGDIRITNAAGDVLDFYIQEYDTRRAIVWIEVDSIPVGGCDVYCYYDTVATSTTTSNGKNTFLAFDDFSAGSLDTDMWGTAAGSTAPNFNATDDRLEFTIGEGIITDNAYAGLERLVCEIDGTGTVERFYLNLISTHTTPWGEASEFLIVDTNDGKALYYDGTTEREGNARALPVVTDRPYITELILDKDRDYVFGIVNGLESYGEAVDSTCTHVYYDASGDSVGDYSPYIRLFQTTASGTTYLNWVAGCKFANPLPVATTGAEETQ